MIALQGIVQNAKPCKSLAEAVAGTDAVLEPKLDGWRIVACCTVDDDGEAHVRVVTRSGQDITGKLPHVEREVLALLPKGGIFDGEAVAYLPSGEQEWGDVQSALGSGIREAVRKSAGIVFVVFDLIEYDQLDARPLPFRSRRNLLESIFTGSRAKCVQLIPQFQPTEENLDALLTVCEGGMVKHLDAPYRSGVRGKGMFKVKPQTTVEAIIVGFEDGKDGWTGLVGAIRFAQLRNGQLVERGTCSGFDMNLRRDMTANPADYIGRVIEVKHMGVWPEGAFRHPQWKRMRDDRDAREVEWHDE